MNKHLNSNITFLRKSRQWSEKELALKINRTEDYIIEMEKGQHIVRIDDIIRISDLFGITIDRLMLDKLTKETQFESIAHVRKSFDKIKAAFNESIECEVKYSRKYYKQDSPEVIGNIERLRRHHSKQYSTLTILIASLIDLLEKVVGDLEILEKSSY